MQGKEYSKKFWNTNFVESMKNNYGVVAQACNKLNVSPQCYYAYRHRCPAFAKKIDKIKEDVILPMLEDIAFSRAIKDNNGILIFLLRNMGGRKWNRDRIEEAFAKDVPRNERLVEIEKSKEEQRMPTEAEKAAAAAYLKVLDEME